MQEHSEKPGTGTSSKIVPVSDLLPNSLYLLPVSQTTLFPGMMVPLILSEGKLSKMVERAMEGNGYVGVVLSTKSPESGETALGPSVSPTGLPPRDGRALKVSFPCFRYGVAAKILKKINLPDNQVSVLLTGLQRFEVRSVLSEDPYTVVAPRYLYDEESKTNELEALMRSAIHQFKVISKDNPLISEEIKVALVNIDGPGKLADFMASVLIRDVSDYQDFLRSVDVKERLHKLLLLLKKEGEVQAVQRQINDEIHQKIAGTQREFYLQEQLKLIQKELGRSTEKSKITDKFRQRLEGKMLTAEAQKRIQEEFEKLQTLNETSSEYSVSVNYLDWATSLPWGVYSKENYSLKNARKVLDADHYGLKEVKERILEYLAVKKLKHSHEGSILCFVGPPGTGKTSLGKSIARALNRKFFRFSVGGMRDEAEIKGHRRTYVGAMPGKLVQGMKRVGSQNPVFLIDEIDKLAPYGMGGDPASALLEVLDSEQNGEFLDHYLDIPFDCSKVFFITTANTTDTIPPALLDRMEVIYLHGYTDKEKEHIARNYLIPKQIRKNALKAKNLRFTQEGLNYIIHRYARESGVRNLEKQISRVCRKVALKVATGKKSKAVLGKPHNVEKFLGMPPWNPEAVSPEMIPGVSTGLAWTQYGGEVLTVESVAVDGKGGLVLTGSLGDVMQESANIAYTYLRNHAKELGLASNYFEKHVLHLHVPAGATPKDGPSAGVTMVASLYSLLSGKALPKGVAMTGEVTLSGRVLAVGGIKEKLLAAQRSHVQTVLLPRQNDRELKEMGAEVKKGLEIVRVGSVEEALRFLFAGSRSRLRVGAKSAKQRPGKTR